jgi:hypothetical protein
MERKAVDYFLTHSHAMIGASKKLRKQSVVGGIEKTRTWHDNDDDNKCKRKEEEEEKKKKRRE